MSDPMDALSRTVSAWTTVYDAQIAASLELANALVPEALPIENVVEMVPSSAVVEPSAVVQT